MQSFCRTKRSNMFFNTRPVRCKMYQRVLLFIFLCKTTQHFVRGSRSPVVFRILKHVRIHVFDFSCFYRRIVFISSYFVYKKLAFF